jgi:hypothetical protein
LPVQVRADNVELAPNEKWLELVGNVKVDAHPFYLKSDRLRVFRSWKGVEFQGQSSLGLCPCGGGPPVAISVEAGSAAPHDLFLKSPVLRIFGVPVLWAPAFWLRSPERFGLLPPDVAWRGNDGMFVGGGLHVPSALPLDVRGGAYLSGGAAFDVASIGSAGSLAARFDVYRGEAGLTVDTRSIARSSAGDPAPRARLPMQWDLDGAWGARAVAAVSDVNLAANPFNRGSMQVTRALGSHAEWWAGWKGVARRGTTSIDAWGPDLGIFGRFSLSRRSQGEASASAYYDVLGREAVGSAALSHALVTPAFKLVDVALTSNVLALGSVLPASVSQSQIQALVRVQNAVTVSLPLARSFGALRHRVAPSLGMHASQVWSPMSQRPSSGADAVTRRGNYPSAAAAAEARLPRGSYWVPTMGLATELGTLRSAGTLDVRVGYDIAGQNVLARARLGVDAHELRAHIESMHVGGAHAWLGRMRVGGDIFLALDLAGADGDRTESGKARVLSDLGHDALGPLMSRDGTALGATFGTRLTSNTRAELSGSGDLLRATWVGVRAMLEFRDRCNCLGMRVVASARQGRPGTDAWVAFELAE